MKAEIMNLIVRQLFPIDADVAKALVRRFHKAEVSIEYLKHILSNPANRLIIAEVDGELAGFLYAHLVNRLRLEEQQIFIYEIEVAPEYQRRGVGSALMRFIRGIADSKGIECFVFTSHSNAQAVSFYKNTGGNIPNGDDLMFVYLPSGSEE